MLNLNNNDKLLMQLSFRKNFSAVWVLLVLLGSLISAPSYAVKLGELSLYSGIKEPLRADIKLEDVATAGTDTLAAIKVDLANRQAYAEAELDRDVFATNVDIKILQAESGPVARLTTLEPVTDSFLTLLLEAKAGDGESDIRQYTVLFDLEPAASGGEGASQHVIAAEEFKSNAERLAESRAAMLEAKNQAEKKAVVEAQKAAEVAKQKEEQAKKDKMKAWLPMLGLALLALIILYVLSKLFAGFRNKKKSQQDLNSQFQNNELESETLGAARVVAPAVAPVIKSVISEDESMTVSSFDDDLSALNDLDVETPLFVSEETSFVSSFHADNIEPIKPLTDSSNNSIPSSDLELALGTVNDAPTAVYDRVSDLDLKKEMVEKYQLGSHSDSEFVIETQHHEEEIETESIDSINAEAAELNSLLNLEDELLTQVTTKVDVAELNLTDGQDVEQDVEIESVDVEGLNLDVSEQEPQLDIESQSNLNELIDEKVESVELSLDQDVEVESIEVDGLDLEVSKQESQFDIESPSNLNELIEEKVESVELSLNQDVETSLLSSEAVNVEEVQVDASVLEVSEPLSLDDVDADTNKLEVEPKLEQEPEVELDVQVQNVELDVQVETESVVSKEIVEEEAESLVLQEAAEPSLQEDIVLSDESLVNPVDTVEVVTEVEEVADEILDVAEDDHAELFESFSSRSEAFTSVDSKDDSFQKALEKSRAKSAYVFDFNGFESDSKPTKNLTQAVSQASSISDAMPQNKPNHLDFDLSPAPYPKDVISKRKLSSSEGDDSWTFDKDPISQLSENLDAGFKHVDQFGGEDKGSNRKVELEKQSAPVSKPEPEVKVVEPVIVQQPEKIAADLSSSYQEDTSVESVLATAPANSIVNAKLDESLTAEASLVAAQADEHVDIEITKTEAVEVAEPQVEAVELRNSEDHLQALLGDVDADFSPANKETEIEVSSYDSEKSVVPDEALKQAQDNLHQESLADSIDDLEFMSSNNSSPEAVNAEVESELDLNAEEVSELSQVKENTSDLKMDLARMYITLGDIESARTTLNEIVADTGSAHAQTAQKLLLQL